MILAVVWELSLIRPLCVRPWRPPGSVSLLLRLRRLHRDSDTSRAFLMRVLLFVRFPEADCRSVIVSIALTWPLTWLSVLLGSRCRGRDWQFGVSFTAPFLSHKKWYSGTTRLMNLVCFRIWGKMVVFVLCAGDSRGCLSMHMEFVNRSKLLIMNRIVCERGAREPRHYCSSNATLTGSPVLNLASSLL